MKNFKLHQRIKVSNPDHPHYLKRGIVIRIQREGDLENAWLLFDRDFNGGMIVIDPEDCEEEPTEA